MKLRTDLVYSLIAFESILVAIASILWFPVWVLAVAIVAFVFSTIEMVVSIVRMRNASYDETLGRKTYKFPVKYFVIFALLLIALTGAVILALKLLFGYMLIAVALLLVGLLALAFARKIHLMSWICGTLALLLLIFLVGYCAAQVVHSGANLNPGLSGEDTQTPGDDTQIPGDDTQAPGEDTQTPGEDTQTPGEDTQAPGEDTQTPGEDTQTPGEDTQTPGDNTQTPEVTPKISAPDTMKYGVPVTVELEGIDADNLKYGNKDFISIVKVSDSEVVLTLVGIVNDAGQVEIVPAAGYITVTDSVSGVNIQIRIVE